MTGTELDIMLILVLAHLLSDFPLQSGKMAARRSSENWNEILFWNIGHALEHFIVMFVVLFVFSCAFDENPLINFNTVCCLILLSFFHFIIDIFKSSLIVFRPFEKHSIYLFLADQVVHLLSIAWISNIINKKSPVFSSISGSFKNTAVLNPDQKLVLALTLIVTGLWGVGIFIRVLFDYMARLPYKHAINRRILIKGVTTDKKDSISPDISFIIGILERLFIIVVLAAGVNEMIIGFVLTAKSVARFKEFDDRDFIVSYIVGTFISFITAIIIGIIIKNLDVFSSLLNKN